SSTRSAVHRVAHSLPTRRSSDVCSAEVHEQAVLMAGVQVDAQAAAGAQVQLHHAQRGVGGDLAAVLEHGAVLGGGAEGAQAHPHPCPSTAELGRGGDLDVPGPKWSAKHQAPISEVRRAGSVRCTVMPRGPPSGTGRGSSRTKSSKALMSRV